MTDEVKHTPGPWWYQEKSDAYTHIVRAGENRFICQLPQDTSGRAEADARLIAAAPDMLAATKAAFLALCDLAEDKLSVKCFEAITQLGQAISKATVRP